MSELTLTVLRLGFLVLLWLFVLFVVGVLRRDLFGTKVTARSNAAARPASRAVAPKPKPQQTRGKGPRQLVVTQGALTGTSIALGESPILLGRGPECTLVLEDDYASSRHARIFPRDGGWVVEDLGSTNGTFLGKTRLSAPVVWSAGQPLRVGKTVLELRK